MLGATGSVTASRKTRGEGEEKTCFLNTSNNVSVLERYLT